MTIHVPVRLTSLSMWGVLLKSLYMGGGGEGEKASS